MTIRPFREGDQAALWKVYYSAVHETASKDYTPDQLNAWAPDDFDAAMWADRMRGINPFIAELNGTIVGYADLQPSGYIDHFFVSATVARQGVGATLMQAIFSAADSQKQQLLFADVSVTARPFFAKWGFEVDAKTTLSLRGFALDNFRMSKRRLQFTEQSPR